MTTITTIEGIGTATAGAAKNVVGRPPSTSEVKRWVAHAKKLKPAVTH